VSNAAPKVALPSRIYIEGRHDAVPEQAFYMKGGIDEVKA
jgi:F0F1-type ATP synthase beta subunit